jgi:hypothetical protein
MTGWVCRLQLLLVLASAVILRSESRRTHDHILLSQFRDSPNRKNQVPVFISPRNRVAPIVFLITTLRGPSIKHSFQQQLYCCVRIRCRGNVFTDPLPRNGLLFIRILHSNGCTCYNIHIAVGVRWGISWKEEYLSMIP